MAQQQQVDFTSVIASMNAMIQVLGESIRSLYAGVRYVHISGAGTLIASDVPVTLLSLNINSGDIGATGTIYDAAGTVSLNPSEEVAVFNLGTVAPVMVPIGPARNGLSLNEGLVVVTTGTADITLGIF